MTTYHFKNVFISLMIFFILMHIVEGYGAETPTSEPGLCAIDMWDSDWDEDPEDFYIYRHQVNVPFVTFISCHFSQFLI